MQNLEWYLADLKSTGKNTIETVETCLLDWLGYIPVYINGTPSYYVKMHLCQ